MKLIRGDCIQVMKELAENGIKADLILTDPPYGTTYCKWDSVIPFKDMWDCIHSLSNEKTPVILFGNEPFSSCLRLSNLNEYKYDWIWIKEKGTNILSVKKRPMHNYELISVFYKESPFYNPIMRRGKPYIKKQRNGRVGAHLSTNPKAHDTINVNGERYPLLTLYVARDTCKGKSYHPTQKPIKLLEYLIKTYTRKDDLVLDFTMGSGSTGVACKNTGRNFIGIELDKNYYNIAKQRINNS